MTDFPPFKKATIYKDVETTVTTKATMSTNQKSAREIADKILSHGSNELHRILARAYLELEKKNTKVTKILNWLVFHAIDTASISKAKGAELLGISLIDMDNYRNSLDIK